jgi:hypothetical protein
MRQEASRNCFYIITHSSGRLIVRDFLPRCPCNSGGLMRTGKKPELGFWYRGKRLAVQIGSGESLMLRAGSFS